MPSSVYANRSSCQTVGSSNRDELTTKVNFYWEMMSVDKCLPREACVMAGNFAEGRTHTPCPGKTTPNINCSNSTKACQFHQKFYKHTHTHTFKGPLPSTTKVSRYQKGKTNMDFSEARDSEWQWHQLGHIQVYTCLLYTSPSPRD